ncbi:MAG: SRPBCC family protein [Alphaproteobacteria bacterium]|nr:SRPBCC family protein [Alphaproteobacteria bacterium]
MTYAATFSDLSTIDAAKRLGVPLRFEGVARFDVSPERLFAYVSEPQNVSQWVPMLKALNMNHAHSKNGSGQCGVGSERACAIGMMGNVVERIIWWDPPKGYAFAFQPENTMMVPTENHYVILLVRSRDKGSELVFRTYFNWRPGLMRFMAVYMMPMMLNMAFANIQKKLGGPGGKFRRVA